MIVAAGLTPAWQQIVTLDSLRPGEVNRARSVDWCASGKVLNVGCALHHLGAASKTISFFGRETGWLMRAEFDSLGVPTRWVETSVPTRICTTILDRSNGATTELVENSRLVTADELHRFLDAFTAEASSAAWAILAGSLPQQTPADFYRRLMEATSAKIVFDARGAELQECLPLKPFLVKPNREELAQTVGQPILTDDELLAAMEELRLRESQRVVISQGAGELWLLNDEGLTRFRPPKVPAVNPISCGDCLAAGITVGFSEGLSDIDAVRLGIAAAAENVQQLLPARLDRKRVEQLAKVVAIIP